MSRRNVVWLITLPLAIVGSQVAHAAGYRLATGEEELAHALSTSGHGYLAYARLVLGVCAALLGLALARELAGALGGDARASRPSAVFFSVLAPAIFLAQEHVERLAHDSVFPGSLLVEKTFLLGLALQVPFALVAYAVARLLLGVTRAVARFLEAPRAAHGKPSRRERSNVWSPAGVATGLRLGPRGPPSLLVA
jgi:hypothetical protein